MKKLIVVVLAFMLIVFCPFAVNVARADSFKTENDINLTDWSVSAGQAPVEAIGENGAKDGVRLLGNGNGNVLSYTYQKELSPFGVMLDFFVDTEKFNYEANPCVEFSFGQENVKFFSVKFTFLDGKYNAELNVGEEKFVAEGMKYKESGHIQFRVSKEEVKDYESGNNYVTWNYILGIQKSSVPKNDKYNVRKNLYDDVEFKKISDALELAVREESVRMTIEAKSEGYCEFGITIKQVSYFCFYDYSVLPNSYITADKVDYTNVAFSFTRPQNLDVYGGFVIERYKKGILDKNFTITNPYAESFSDTHLKQDTDYKYIITALKNVSATNRVACTTIAFKYEDYTVHTTKGYLWKLVVGVASIIVVATLFVVCYVYFYDIKRLIKK